MQLLPEEVPLLSSPEVSAVCGQRAVPSHPLTCEQMAKRLTVCRKLIPYGRLSQRRQWDHTASLLPKLSAGHNGDLTSRASLYCGSYGETSDSSSSCSGRVFSKSRGDHLPCSCKRFPWDHQRTLECRLLAAGLSDRDRGSGVFRGWGWDLVSASGRGLGTPSIANRSIFVFLSEWVRQHGYEKMKVT